MKAKWQTTKSSPEELSYINSLNGVTIQGSRYFGTAPSYHPGENINADGEFVPAPGFGTSETSWQARAEEAEAELKAIEEYCGAVLDCKQTVRGSRFTANRVLDILRGES